MATKKRGRPRLTVTDEQKRELLELEQLRRSQEAALNLTKQRFAAAVEDAGIAASGRALGMSSQTIFERVKSVRLAKVRPKKRSA